MASGSRFAKLKGRLTPGPFARGFAWYSFVIASWVPAAIFFKGNVGDIGEVGGESMYPYLNPTFHQGFAKDLCWISKRQPATNLQRGMIVTFWYVRKSNQRADANILSTSGAHHTRKSSASSES
jgi:mitochondrial inner membrane protease subunit 2